MRTRGYLGQIGELFGAPATTRSWNNAVGADFESPRTGNPRGAVWYSESGIEPNTVVRFDPPTEKFQTWPIPSGGGVVRNMMPTRDDNLVLALSGVNKIALVEMK